MRPVAWTRPDDVRAALRRKWQSGALLTAFADGADWEPLGFPLRGPNVGSNLIPGRAWIDSYEAAWGLLGVLPEVRRFTELAEATRDSCPRLVPWLGRHPIKALQLSAVWEQVLGTVRWIDERQRPGMYLRQVDVPGVDSKFIEGHRGVLTQLLDLQLDPDRVDAAAVDFSARYGFRRKPGYVRFRCTGLSGSGFCGFSEMTVRLDELATAPRGITRVYVVENEITYLAFPLTGDAMVIFGAGYAVSVLEPLGWLAGLDLVYWGDIDTHGFTILDRLRRLFPHARSMLMDRGTLLAHRTQWVTEPNPSAGPLNLLDAEEAQLYHHLVADALGPSVRLEQERVSFAAIQQATLNI